MKSLKKLAAVAALLSAMNFAKADQKEVQYGPTDYEGGKIDGIELVNGHLLVRSNGKFGGFEMPYGYMSTNTQNFAQSAFAQGGATNVTKYVHAGNGKIYMTFGHADGVYTTQVSSKEGPGCVPADVKDPNTGAITEYAIKKVENPEQDPIAQAMLKNSNVGPMAVSNGSVFTFKQENGKYVLYKDGEPATNDFLGGTGFEKAGVVPESMVFVENTAPYDPILYVLAKDAQNTKRIYTADPDVNYKEADSISVADEGKKLMIQSGSNISTYDPKVGGNPETVSTPSGVQGIPADAKSVVVAGKTTYYATDKKVGYIKD